MHLNAFAHAVDTKARVSKTKKMRWGHQKEAKKAISYNLLTDNCATVILDVFKNLKLDCKN